LIEDDYLLDDNLEDLLDDNAFNALNKQDSEVFDEKYMTPTHLEEESGEEESDHDGFSAIEEEDDEEDSFERDRRSKKELD
jgi:hypothetical protein